MPPPRRLPDYDGGSLLNLIGELEHRLTGESPSARLHRHLGDLLPDAASYLIVVCDGLGAGQLGHPRAASLAGAMAGQIDACFPTTTTVNLATIATGLAPSRHGILGYQLYLPDAGDSGEVANTIKWTTLWGEPLAVDTAALLPRPNLWERLVAAGVEPVTVQPAHFAGSPLSLMLYRGCRFEGITTYDDLVHASVDLASTPGRLVLAYLPEVDYAAHVHGQASPEYAAAIGLVDTMWSRMASRIRPGVTMVGTADHGHLDVAQTRQIRIRREHHDGRVFSGDSRVMFVHGDGAELAEDLPATWVSQREMDGWWGPGPVESAYSGRLPDGALVADDGHMVLHRYSDQRLIGNHGGLTEAELRIPLLVAR